MNKKKHAQAKQLMELLHAYCLSYPLVYFEFDCPPRPVFKKKSQSDIPPILDLLYGSSFSKGLKKYEITAEETEFPVENPLKMLLYLPAPTQAEVSNYFRSNNDRCFFLLNQRPVDLPNEMKLIFRFLRKFFAVSSKLYPFVFLQVEMDPGSFDRKLFTRDHHKLTFT